MLNHRSQTTKSTGMWPVLVLACFTLGQAGPAAAQPVHTAAQCINKTYEQVVPDPATLTLREGENVIASVRTTTGILEARVTLTGKAISDPPKFYLGGKLLTVTPESQLPETVRACLKTAALPSESWLANATRSALDWIVAAAYAKGPCKWIVTEIAHDCKPGTTNCIVFYKLCYCGKCEYLLTNIS